MNRLLTTVLTAAGLLILAPRAKAESMVALTANNQLVFFNSTSPGSAGPGVPVTGLTSGDTLVGIDLRPATGQLYGFATNGSVGRVYAIDMATGAASGAQTLAADPTDTTPPFPFSGVSGGFFGVDFNPAVDRLRITSNTGQNLRVNVGNGLTQLDVDLAYPASGDPNSGTAPTVVASAYSNNVPGAPGGTTLYNIDAGTNFLTTQIPPNDGQLNSVALLSGTAGQNTAFDISGATGTAFVSLDGANLATLNLANGNVTALGAINAGALVIDITAVPEPGSLALVGLAVGGAALRRWKKSAVTPTR